LDSLCLDSLDSSIDFALIFAVVHEVPDVGKFFTELSQVLKPGASVLFIEPKGHVSAEEFEQYLSLAKGVGFTELDHPRVWRCRAVLLSKQTPG
jgi:ubiquinone/menaquinone biosynthesis C-methylase UbiE